VTWSGPIPKTSTHGQCHPEAPVGSLAKRFPQRYAADDVTTPTIRILTSNLPVQPRQQPTTHRPRPSAGQRRLQIPLPIARSRHRLVGAQLLLPLWQRGIHHDARRRLGARLQNLQRGAGSQARGAGRQTGRWRILLVNFLVWVFDATKREVTRHTQSSIDASSLFLRNGLRL